MKPTTKSLGERWKEHQQEWKACEKCKLCDHRKRPAIYKGTIPCDVLFVGEGPGISEDVFGKPFVGPSGIMLDDHLRKSGLTDFRLGFTNMVACLPKYKEKGEDTYGIKAPKTTEMDKCSPRLIELWDIASPKFVVFVGDLPKKYFPLYLPKFDYVKRSVMIIHPGSILRMDASQKPLAIQNNIVTLGQFADKVALECQPI